MHIPSISLCILLIYKSTNLRIYKSMKRIVTIGGGTGSFVLLSGLKKYPVELGAIVTMADDGGSTGRLRDELGVLPPGDIRQCLVALSESSEMMRELMLYRFENGDLKGHNFGNLFVSALEKSCGSLTKGIEEITRILKVRGMVIPVTEEDMRLKAELEDGTKLHGEDALDEDDRLRRQGVRLTNLSLEKKVSANPKALEYIRKADLIVLGPADHYSNIISNLLVSGMVQAIKKSRAHVVYVSALTNKRGLTDGWGVQDYVNSLEKYIGRGRIDSVVCNVRKIPEALMRRYDKHEGNGMLVSCPVASDKTYTILRASVAATDAVKSRKGDAIAHTRSFIRHDSDDLARAIMFLLEFKENRRVIKEIL